MKDQPMKTKLHAAFSPDLISRRVCGGVLILLACTWSNAACAQDGSGITGSFSVSETWTVTIAEDNGETPTFSKTYHGTFTGRATISNGNFSLINLTGLPLGSASPRLEGQTVH